jgi:lambda family phage minor tail protein L
MPEPINNNFTTEKNKAENIAIMLYDVTLNDASIFRICEWDQIIEYPTGSGNVYQPFPVTHEGIGVNAMGEIDAIKVKMSNVDQTIMAILVASDGLVGNQVVMTLVFSNWLADADANISGTYWIDSVESSEQEVIFTLTSKLDLYQVQIPGRIMMRDFCQWEFMCEGCWLDVDGTWTSPDGFLHPEIACDHTRRGTTGCQYHGNTKRFGGFPGIPMRGVFVV